MFVKNSSQAPIAVTEGIQRKTLAVGAHTLMAEFAMAAGKQLPLHSHPHEQIGYLVSGKIILTIGEESSELLPGDSWAVPGNVLHSATVLADAVAIEVFYPVREDYL